MNNEEKHSCDTCGITMSEGFVIEDGLAYFCNDHQPSYYEAYRQADIDDAIAHGHEPNPDTYWTQWED